MQECTDSNECPLCAKNVTNAVDLLRCQYMKYVSWKKMCSEIMLLHDVIVKMVDNYRTSTEIVAKATQTKLQ